MGRGLCLTGWELNTRCESKFCPGYPDVNKSEVQLTIDEVSAKVLAKLEANQVAKLSSRACPFGY